MAKGLDDIGRVFPGVFHLRCNLVRVELALWIWVEHRLDLVGMVLLEPALLILILGIPLTSLLTIANQARLSINFQIAAALLWTGIGITLLLLSRDRRARSS